MGLIILSAALCGVCIFLIALSPAWILPAAAGLAVLTGWSLVLLRRGYMDPLTGLYNLRHLEARKGRYRRCSRLMVIFIDLDHLKQVNDARGHAAGDQLLRELATYLEELADGRAETYRIGGDEFLLILQQDDLPPLESLARFPASYGFAFGPGNTLDSLIREADADLYRRRNRR